jgi:hypothetical protein
VLHAFGVPAQTPPRPASAAVQTQPSETHWVWKFVVVLVQLEQRSGVPPQVPPTVQPWQSLLPQNDVLHCEQDV